MKIAITGARGMLGRALCQVLQSGHTIYPLASCAMDVASLQSVRQILSDLKPDWIVHAAAYTHVDEAEANSFEAYRINALGTRNIACVAQEQQASLLYFSTDYVFDGESRQPYREWDAPNPLNEYARSKLAGEHFVRALCPQHLIIRTSWLFGPRGENSPPHFVDKILSRAARQKCLNVIDDQRGCPSFAPDLAKMTQCLMERRARGTYHVTNSGECTWYEFACEILALKNSEVGISPVSSLEFSAAAKRPHYSVLDNYLLKLEGVPLLRFWKEALAEFLQVGL